jgi:hypothetical protein
LNIQWRIIAVVSLIALQIILGVGVFKYGYDKGVALSESKYHKADIKALEKVITQTEALVSEAEKASLAINQTISDRAKADHKTTQDIRNALSTTAHLRVDCVFDNNVMQQLGEAADRADQAAASGIVSAMPARTTPD